MKTITPILRMADVVRITGLSRPTICRRVAAKEFPAPKLLGGPQSRAVGWKADDVQHWIDSRPTA